MERRPVLRRTLDLALTLVVAWFVMTLTHEFGHVAAGWATGATLVDVRWLGLPGSAYEPNPRPAWVWWAGPGLGVVLPVLLAVAVSVLLKHPALRRLAPQDLAWGWRERAWLVADFSVLANGVYLVLAWFSGESTLDTARLLDAGVHPVWIVLFCAATIGIGYPRFVRGVRRVLSGTAPQAEEPSAANDAPRLETNSPREDPQS